jgi:hypothetical protein
MEESKKKLIIGGAGAVVVIAAVAFFLWPTPEPETPLVKEATPKSATDEAANYPVPQPKADAAPLPELGESDSLFADSVAALFGNDTVQNLLVKTDIARHIVVTVDNLPRKKVAERLKPVKPIPGKFLVTGPEGAQTIASENTGRYSTAVRLLDAVDTQALAASYFKMYPLLQKAYVDLGYPNGYFNNRLVEVIDHLLATPDVSGPIQVVQPNVMYEFADPRLEALSSGQKTLIRMGPAHAATVKKKLRELRAIIAAKAPSSQNR